MHEKEIEKLQAEKEKVERQLVQEQHIIQRLENRAAYYEKGDRRKRAHRLITRGAAIEGGGRNEVRVAYVLKKEDLIRALFILRKALEAYPGRVDE